MPISATEMAANLEAFWPNVTPQDLTSGMKAYTSYHDTIRAFADFYGVGFIPAVEAFVLLSPNNDYHGNLRSLASVLDGWARGADVEDIVVTTFNRMRNKAYGILLGEVSFHDHVKGQKVTSFRDNILYLDGSKRVTVDGHMVAVLSGKDLTMKEATFEMRRAPYAHWERAVVRFAKKMDVSPCQMQAALWMARKRVKSIRMSTQEELFSGGTKWDAVLDPLDFPPYTKAEQKPKAEKGGCDAHQHALDLRAPTVGDVIA